MADHAQQARTRTERSGVARNVGGAAEPVLLTLHMHDRHGRLGRDAIDVAEPVAIEHDVADHQNAGVGQPTHGLGQIRMRLVRLL